MCKDIDAAVIKKLGRGWVGGPGSGLADRTVGPPIIGIGVLKDSKVRLGI